MSKLGKIHLPFVIRIIGAIFGVMGFFFLAYQQNILGTALVGLGSFLIAVGEQ